MLLIVRPPVFRIGLIVVTLAVATTLAPSASATIILALDMGELVSQADHVVIGTVTSTATQWDTRGRIVTDYAVHVEQTLKGESSSTGRELTVRCLGGAIGEIGMRIAGEPSFEIGDRAIFFLRANGTLLRPVGMSQGVLAIVEREGVPTVLPGGGGMSLVQPVRGGELTAAPPALMHPRPLDEVVRDVRALVATTPQQRQ